MVIHPHFIDRNQLTPSLRVMAKKIERSTRARGGFYISSGVYRTVNWACKAAWEWWRVDFAFKGILWWLSFFVFFILSMVRLNSYRMICGSWILEHFDNKGKKRCSGRGGGGTGAVLLCRFLADETNPQSVGNTFLLSLFPTNNGHKTIFFSFNERPDTATLYLIVDFDPRKSERFLCTN